MTYPEPAVAATITRDVLPVRLNVREDAAKPAIERYRQVWTPDLHLLGPDGFDYYHWNGYLPPFEYLPQLLVAIGQARLRVRDFARAADIYRDVLTRFPTSHVAPEALYYLTVARYEATHNPTDLHAGWHQIQSRYPDSLWRIKQAFSENP